MDIIEMGGNCFGSYFLEFLVINRGKLVRISVDSYFSC